MPPLQFKLDLSGNFAAALRPVNAGLGETEDKLKKNRKEVDLFEAELGSLKAAAGGFSLNFSGKGGSMFGFDLAEGIHMAVDAIRSMVGAVADLGKEMLKTAAEAQDLDLAIKLNVGEEGAGQIQALAESIASNTRFDDGFVKTSLLPLLEQGVTDTGLLDDMFTAAADLAARKSPGNTKAGVQNAMEAFSLINLKGEVDTRALRALDIGEADYFKHLGSILGVSEKRAQELAKEGKVKTKTLLDAVLDERARKQGGSLGEPTLESGKTLGATLDRLSDLKGDLLEKLAHTPGLARLQTVLDNFVTVMSGPEGTRLMDDVGKAIGEIAEGLFGKDGKSGLLGPDGIRSMTSTVRGVIDFLKEAFNWFRGTIEMAVGGFKLVKQFVMSTTGQANAEEVVNALKLVGVGGTRRDFGGDAAAGMQLALEGKVADAEKSGAALGDGLKAGLDKSLDAHSPSREMIRRGMNAGESFAMGVDHGAEAVRESTRRSIAEVVTGGAAVAGHGMGAGLVIGEGAVQVHINGVGGDPESMRQATRQGARQGLRDVLTEAGYGSGSDGGEED